MVATSDLARTDPHFAELEAVHFLADEADVLRIMASFALAGLEAAEANNMRLATLLEKTVAPMARELADLRRQVGLFAQWKTEKERQ
jgi:hypothetical protein